MPDDFDTEVAAPEMGYEPEAAYVPPADEPPAEEPPAEKRQKRRGTIDTARQVVTFTDGERSIEYPYGDMPPVSVAYLAGFALRHLLLASDTPTELYQSFRSGILPVQREPAKPKLSPLRQAIALALVDATKKQPRPLTLDAAQAQVAAMTRDQTMALRTDPAVIKHLNKLLGILSGGVAALAQQMLGEAA